MVEATHSGPVNLNLFQRVQVKTARGISTQKRRKWLALLFLRWSSITTPLWASDQVPSHRQVNQEKVAPS